jgi:hypothetical protein
MSFKLPDLIVESLIRDGFDNARRDLSVIDDVFCDLSMKYNRKKYGSKEINKIKEIIEKEEVSIVHSFNLVNANIPCISIQLADDREDEGKASMGNFVQVMNTPITDTDALAALVIVESFQPNVYSPNSGIVKVPDTVDLSAVHANLLFVDAAGVEHSILGGIVNTPGKKQFIIDKQHTVDLGPGAEIKSSINYNQYERKGNTEQTHLILGIHTRDALLTKYLYVLVKYFMLSRQNDAIARGLQISSYTGSDFTRNIAYEADVVYTRFFNVSGMVQHQWRADKVKLIDHVTVQVLVPKDRLGNEALDLTEQTIQVKE